METANSIKYESNAQAFVLWNVYCGCHRRTAEHRSRRRRCTLLLLHYLSTRPAAGGGTNVMEYNNSRANKTLPYFPERLNRDIHS